MFIIRDRETGTEIDYFDKKEDAEAMLTLFEIEDKKDGIYIPNFYEIVELKKENENECN